MGDSVAAGGPVRYEPGQCGVGGGVAGGVDPWGTGLAGHQWSVFQWSQLVSGVKLAS